MAEVLSAEAARLAYLIEDSYGTVTTDADAVWRDMGIGPAWSGKLAKNVDLKWQLDGSRLADRGIEGVWEVDGERTCWLQDGRLLAFVFGKVVEGGTEKTGGVSTTLASASSAGDDTISVADATGVDADEYLRVGAAGDTEVRKVKSVSANDITFYRPLRRAHANGADVVELDGPSASTPITHTLTPVESTELPSMTVEVASVLTGANDFVRRYRGMVMASAELALKTGDPLQLRATFVGKDVDTSQTSPTSYTATSVAPYAWDEVTTLTVGGSSLPMPSEFTLSLDNGAEGKPALANSQYIDRVVAGRFTAECRIKTLVEDGSYWTKLATADQTDTVVLTVTRGTGDSLTITLTDAVLVEAPHDIPDEGPVEVDLVYRATGAGISITVQDSIHAYLI